MSYKMNRRKFLTYVGCGCCGFVINSCSTAPITDRKQLKLIPEAKLNAQAAKIYEKVKEKEKLIKDTKSINEIKEIGKKMENAVSAFFEKEEKKDPTKKNDYGIAYKMTSQQKQISFLNKYFIFKRRILRIRRYQH